MRDRCWRRHTEDKKVLKRLKNSRIYQFYVYYPHFCVHTIKWYNLIGTPTHHLYKTTVSKYKNKWRWDNKYYRTSHKQEFINTLKYEGVL